MVTDEERVRLQKKFSPIKALRRDGGFCNRLAQKAVFAGSVDTISNTWMILMLARWFKLRSHMMTTQLVSWLNNCIRSSQKSSGAIGHAEPLKKTFAK